MIILAALVSRAFPTMNWRRKAKLNPSLTLLPHRRPNDVSRDEWQ